VFANHLDFHDRLDAGAQGRRRTVPHGCGLGAGR
jgi:hypothetical protein